MRRTERCREAVYLRFADQGKALLRIGIDNLRIHDAIFTAGNGSQLGFNGDASAVRQVDQMAGDRQVFRKRQMGAIKHNRAKAGFNGRFAGLARGPVIEMQCDRNINL